MIFYVERNNNHTFRELHRKVYSLYEDQTLICIGGANVLRDRPEDVVQHFTFAYQMSGKALYIRFHCFGIDFQDIRDLSLIQQITDAVIDLLSAQYQVLSGILGRKQGYQAVFLINSIGIDGRTVFYDRNQTYRELLDILKMIVGAQVNVELNFAYNVLFTNKKNKSENYETYLGGWQ